MYQGRNKQPKKIKKNILAENEYTKRRFNSILSKTVAWQHIK